MGLAKINGLFRLTRDAEIVHTQSGSSITKLGLACSEKYKDKETQLFLDAVAFGKVGEIISQYAGQKGTQIYLNGKLQTESWQDKQSGQNRSKVSMTIEGFDFVGGQNNQQPQQGQAYQAPQQQAPQQQYRQPEIVHENIPRDRPQQPPVIDVSEDEIPF